MCVFDGVLSAHLAFHIAQCSAHWNLICLLFSFLFTFSRNFAGLTYFVYSLPFVYFTWQFSFFARVFASSSFSSSLFFLFTFHFCIFAFSSTNNNVLDNSVPRRISIIMNQFALEHWPNSIPFRIAFSLPTGICHFFWGGFRWHRPIFKTVSSNATRVFAVLWFVREEKTFAVLYLTVVCLSGKWEFCCVLFGLLICVNSTVYDLPNWISPKRIWYSSRTWTRHAIRIMWNSKCFVFRFVCWGFAPLEKRHCQPDSEAYSKEFCKWTHSWCEPNNLNIFTNWKVASLSLSRTCLIASISPFRSSRKPMLFFSIFECFRFCCCCLGPELNCVKVKMINHVV